MTDEELAEEIQRYTENRCIALEKENKELTSLLRVRQHEIALLQRCCRQFNAGTMIEFAAYVLYYTANPETKMDIPNCVYEKVEKIYADWNKQHKDNTHDDDEVSRVDEQQGIECISELKAGRANDKSHMCLETLIKQKAVKEASTKTLLKELKDRGVIRSWYYNGTYHVGNELY